VNKCEKASDHSALEVSSNVQTDVPDTGVLAEKIFWWDENCEL